VIGKASVQCFQLKVKNVPQFLFAQRLEDNKFVNAIEELGWEAVTGGNPN
jgi:hypothetical protein